MNLDKFFQSLVLTSTVVILISTPAKGGEVVKDVREANKNIPQLSEIELPATSAIMLVQSPTPNSTPATQVVPITGVKANPTSKGVEVILETPLGTQLQVTNRSTAPARIIQDYMFKEVRPWQ